MGMPTHIPGWQRNLSPTSRSRLADYPPLRGMSKEWNADCRGKTRVGSRGFHHFGSLMPYTVSGSRVQAGPGADPLAKKGGRRRHLLVPIARSSRLRTEAAGPPCRWLRDGVTARGCNDVYGGAIAEDQDRENPPATQSWGIRPLRQIDVASVFSFRFLACSGRSRRRAWRKPGSWPIASHMQRSRGQPESTAARPRITAPRVQPASCSQGLAWPEGYPLGNGCTQ
jgi:hypothetical protein